MAQTNVKKPRRKKIRLRRLLCVVVLLCVSLYATFLFIRIERGIYAKEKEAEQQVMTDDYYEKIAREKLGLVNVNEQVFVDISKKSSAE